MCVAIGVCFVFSSPAANILVNPGFESAFNGWTMHTTESWSMGPNNTLVHSGSWGLWMQGLYGNGGAPSPYISYAYQTIACAPGSTFTADAWFSQWVSGLPSEGGSGNGSGLFGANIPGNPGYYEDGWVEVVFLDSGNNILADYKSAIINPAYVANLVSIGATTSTATTTNLTWFDVPVTNQYDPTTIVLNADPDPNSPAGTTAVIINTLSPGQYMVAPAGTVSVQFRLALCQSSNCSGAPHWDDCVLNQVGGPSPSVVGSVSPDGSKFFYRGTNNFTFTVTSASTGGAGLPNNPTNGIKVVMNGVNQTASLQFSGTPTAWNVTLPGLVSNTVYNASITVSNSAGLITTASYSFDTFDGSDFVVPSETYDFTNGMFIQNWIPTAAPAANSYYGLGGVWGVDMNTYGAVGALPAGAVQLVRADGCVAFQGTSGAQLPIYAAQNNNNVYNIALAYNNAGNWENYTRNYPAGTYVVYAWISGGAGQGDEYLNELTGGYGTPTQTTNNLGEFNLPNGTDWNHYMWVPLTYGRTPNLATVTFTGGQQTLQLQSGPVGGENVAWFILVPTGSALGAPPAIGNYNPAINLVNAFVNTTTLTFSVSSSSSTIATSKIQTLLNGADISSLATYTAVGTGNTNWTVSVPVPQDQTLTLAINATDANGVSNNVAWSFDTFSQNNFMIEAEDWDFNGGQFIDNPIPTGAYVANTYPGYAYTAVNSYFYYPSNSSANAAIVGVDLTTPNDDAGETEIYRPFESAGTEVCSDFLRQKFLSGPFNDFDLGWWNPGTWVNYTRTFPANNYYVYGRLASGGAYSGLTLSLVTSGVGTPTQATQLLGSFSDPNANGYQSWHWVPLLDGNGNLVTVSLSGKETLKATSPAAGANANFYMFVPAMPVVNLTASVSGANIHIQFPSQTGNIYTVLWSSSLTGGNWQTLTSVNGDGTVKTVTDTMGSSQRFYTVLVQ